MPPQRTPLGAISGNRKDGKHLSPYQRTLIAGKASEGADIAQISRDLFLLPASVRYTILQHDLRHEGHSLVRKPRKKSYTDADERVLLRHVRLHPKDTYKQVKEACGLDCSKRTIQRVLKASSITN